MIEINDTEFTLLRDYLLRVSGIKVPRNKRYLFTTRLSAFLEKEGCKSFSMLYNKLNAATDTSLQIALVQAMTTHESSFWRDKHPFELLSNKLIQQIADCKIANSRMLAPRIRIFSAGCSLGQEPYTIAMCINEWLATQDRFKAEDVTLLSADISQEILRRARKGEYTQLEMGTHLPEKFRKKYFIQHENVWRVTSEIKSMVKFIQLNLAERFEHIGKMDILFCRNVIIYFPLEVKHAILEQFYRMLRPDGALILGGSESIYGLSDQFTVHHEGKATYYTPKTK